METTIKKSNPSSTQIGRRYIRDSSTPIPGMAKECKTCMRFPGATEYHICFVEDECKAEESKFWKREM